MKTLQETIKQFFNVNLPISGGDGQSVDTPIIIHSTENPVPMEYKIIGFIQELGNKTWRMEKQELINLDGKNIDKVSIVLYGDTDNYRNYYFDITQFQNI